MNPGIIPVRLSVEEICAAALMDAADNLDVADDARTFVDALEENHRLWLILRDVDLPARESAHATHDGDCAFTIPAVQGRCTSDAAVSAMIAINQRIAARFAAGIDLENIRARVRLVHRESRSMDGLAIWTQAQIANLRRRSLGLCPDATAAGKPPLISSTVVRAIGDLEQMAMVR